MSTLPPAVAGITWRPATLGDIPEVANLAAAVDEIEGLEFVGGPEFWNWWFRQHDLASDTLLAIDEDAAVIGLAGSYFTDSEIGARAILWLDSHPDRLDLEPLLLAWAVARAREQVSSSSHPDKVLRVSAEEHRTRRRNLLEAEGFIKARTFVDMERSLTGDLPDPRPAPEGITVVPWTPDLDEPARLVSNAAFRSHWGSLPMDAETWAAMGIDPGAMRRDCSFIAVAGDEAIAICLAEVEQEDDPTKLLIPRVGTRPDWQRRGLASILLTTTLHAAAETGFLTSTLTVDEESRSGATAVYADLGYRVTSRSITYVLEASS